MLCEAVIYIRANINPKFANDITISANLVGVDYADALAVCGMRSNRFRAHDKSRNAQLAGTRARVVAKGRLRDA